MFLTLESQTDLVKKPKSQTLCSYQLAVTGEYLRFKYNYYKLRNMALNEIPVAILNYSKRDIDKFFLTCSTNRCRHRYQCQHSAAVYTHKVSNLPLPLLLPTNSRSTEILAISLLLGQGNFREFLYKIEYSPINSCHCLGDVQ